MKIENKFILSYDFLNININTVPINIIIMKYYNKYYIINTINNKVYIFIFIAFTFTLKYISFVHSVYERILHALIKILK